MMTVRHRVTPALKKFRFDWTFIFCVLTLGLAPVSSVFWFFIPVAVSLMLQTHLQFGQAISLLSLGLSLSAPWWFDRNLSAFDILGLVILFSLGLALWGLRQRKQSFLTYILWPLGVGFFSACVLVVSMATQTRDWSYSSWAIQQMASEIFPYFFHGDRYPEPTRYLFDSFFAPILKPALMGWFAALMAMAFFVNGIMENLLKSFRVANIRGQARVFDRLNHWKISDYILIPLVLGLVIVSADYFFFQGRSAPLQLVGWNVLVLALFPIFVQGIALSTFLIPRVNFLFVLMIFLVLIVNPVPVLVLAGLGDLWFDLRSKMNTPPNEGME